MARPRSEAIDPADRDAMILDFERFLAPLGLNADPGDLGLLLDWKESYGDGRLGRWRRSELEQFLLDWCPAKLSATADEVRAMPATVALAMSFLAERGLLERGSDAVEQLTEYAVGLQAAFMAEMDDPANFGMAKSLFGGLDLDPDELTPAALDEAIARFNELPDAERHALTGADAGFFPDDIVIGPVVLPDERELRAAALASPALQAFVQLGDYFAAPGVPLTATGNLRLADARALVDLLGTDDVFREQGTQDWQGSTRSASQLPGLDHWKWWASEVGVLRRRQGRLVAVEAWRKRARKDPLRELLDALHVLLLDAGPLQSYSWWWDSPVAAALDASVGPLLSRLLQTPDGLAYDDLLQEWRSLLERLGLRESYPGHLDGDFSRLFDILVRVGVVAHHDGALLERAYGSPVKSGGTVVVTPVGAAFAVDALREHGLTVEVVPEPSRQTVAGLTALVDKVEPEEWWDTLRAWLDAQPERGQQLGDLLIALERLEPLALLPVVLEAAPAILVDRLVPTMRQLALQPVETPGDLNLLAADWLARHAPLEGGEVDPDRVLVGAMVALGRLAAAAPALLVEALADSDHAHDLYAFLGLVGQRLPPHAVELLEALGQHHPDKGVAKAARKELFRTRSRLVQQSRRPRS
jgi:hypothetical protein